MINESNLIERVEVLKRIMARVEFLGLSNFTEVVQLDNLHDCEVYFISYALNIESKVVYDSWPQNSNTLESILKKFITYLELDKINCKSLYDTLLYDSIIPKSPFIKSYLSSHPKPVDSISNLFFSESLYTIHSLTLKLNLFEETNSLIRLTVSNSKPVAENDKIYTLNNSTEFLTQTNRKDNFLIFGCNTKNDKVIDVNFYNVKGGGNESLIGILALKSDGIYAADLTSNGNIGIGISNPLELTKGNVIRLGNLAFLIITGVRSTKNPFIKLKITGQENEYYFDDIDREYFVGKAANEINCLISGVSNIHCCIYFNKDFVRWMIRDEDSTNGTYILLKNQSEYETNIPSSVNYLGQTDEQDFVLSLGSQKFLIQIVK